MTKKSQLDLASGVVIALFGACVAFYALAHYPLGTVQRMGPGMFPVALGCLIAGLGVLLGVTAIFSTSAIKAAETVEWRTAFLVLAAVGLFSVLAGTAGLIPAIIAAVAVSALADRKNSPLAIIVLSAALCLLAIVIFRFGLGMNFRFFGWAL